MNTRKAVTAMLVVTLAIALPGWYIFGRTDQSKTVYADFSYVGGIYEEARSRSSESASGRSRRWNLAELLFE